jgi:hypothetical protein
MTHPALALLRAGSPSEAIAYLRQSGDHPSGLALLEAGFNDFAEVVLEKCARTPVEAVLGTPSAMPVSAEAEKTSSGQENRVSGHVGRAA